MKKLILILIALAAITGAGYGQRVVSDSSEVLLVITDSTTSSNILIDKTQVFEINHTAGRDNTSMFSSARLRNYNFNVDQYSQFSDGDELYRWVYKATYNEYDSIIWVYDGTIADTVKYYIEGDMVRFTSFGNDGTNITKIQ